MAYFTARKKKPSAKYSVELFFAGIVVLISFVVKTIVIAIIEGKNAGFLQYLAYGLSGIYAVVGGLQFEGLTYGIGELSSTLWKCMYFGTSVVAGLVVLSVITAKASYEIYSAVAIKWIARFRRLARRPQNVFLFTSLTEDSITLAKSIASHYSSENDNICKKISELKILRANAKHDNKQDLVVALNKEIKLLSKQKRQSTLILFSGNEIPQFMRENDLCRAVMSNSFYYYSIIRGDDVHSSLLTRLKLSADNLFKINGKGNCCRLAEFYFNTDQAKKPCEDDNSSNAYSEIALIGAHAVDNTHFPKKIFELLEKTTKGTDKTKKTLAKEYADALKITKPTKEENEKEKEQQTEKEKEQKKKEQEIALENANKKIDIACNEWKVKREYIYSLFADFSHYYISEHYVLTLNAANYEYFEYKRKDTLGKCWQKLLSKKISQLCNTQALSLWLTEEVKNLTKVPNDFAKMLSLLFEKTVKSTASAPKNCVKLMLTGKLREDTVKRITKEAKDNKTTPLLDESNINRKTVELFIEGLIKEMFDYAFKVFFCTFQVKLVNESLLSGKTIITKHVKECALQTKSITEEKNAVEKALDDLKQEDGYSITYHQKNAEELKVLLSENNNNIKNLLALIKQNKDKNVDTKELEKELKFLNLQNSQLTLELKLKKLLVSLFKNNIWKNLQKTVENNHVFRAMLLGFGGTGQSALCSLYSNYIHLDDNNQPVSFAADVYDMALNDYAGLFYSTHPLFVCNEVGFEIECTAKKTAESVYGSELPYYALLCANELPVKQDGVPYTKQELIKLFKDGINNADFDSKEKENLENWLIKTKDEFVNKLCLPHITFKNESCNGLSFYKYFDQKTGTDRVDNRSDFNFIVIAFGSDRANIAAANAIIDDIKREYTNAERDYPYKQCIAVNIRESSNVDKLNWHANDLNSNYNDNVLVFPFGTAEDIYSFDSILDYSDGIMQDSTYNMLASFLNENYNEISKEQDDSKENESRYTSAISKLIDLWKTQKHPEREIKNHYALIMDILHNHEKASSEIISANELNWLQLSAYKQESNFAVVLFREIMKLAIKEYEGRGKDNAFIEKLSRLEHERWNRFYISNGWVYNKKKNEELKYHNCITPFDCIPSVITYPYDMINVAVAIAEIAKENKKSETK